MFINILDFRKLGVSFFWYCNKGTFFRISFSFLFFCFLFHHTNLISLFYSLFSFRSFIPFLLLDLFLCILFRFFPLLFPILFHFLLYIPFYFFAFSYPFLRFLLFLFDFTILSLHSFFPFHSFSSFLPHFIPFLSSNPYFFFIYFYSFYNTKG